MAPAVSNNRNHVSPRIRELQARLLTAVPLAPPNISTTSNISPPPVQTSESVTAEPCQEIDGSCSSTVQQLPEQQYDQHSQPHLKSRLDTPSCSQSDLNYRKSSGSSQHEPVCISTSCQTDSCSETPSSFSKPDSRKSSQSSFTDVTSMRPSDSSQTNEGSRKSSHSSTQSQPISQPPRLKKYSSTTVSHSHSECVYTSSHVPVTGRVDVPMTSWSKPSPEHSPKLISQQYSARCFDTNDSVDHRSLSAVQRLSRYIDRLSIMEKRPEHFGCHSCCGPAQSDLSLDIRMNQFKSLPNLDLIQRDGDPSVKLNDKYKTGNAGKQDGFLSRTPRSNLARQENSILKRRTKSVVRFSRSADRPEKHCRSCSCLRSRNSNIPSLIEVDGCVILCDNWLDSSKFHESSRYVPPDLLDRFFGSSSHHHRLDRIDPTHRNLHCFPAGNRWYSKSSCSDKKRKSRGSRRSGDQEGRGVGHWFLWGQPTRHKFFGSLRRSWNHPRIRPSIAMLKGSSDYRQRWNMSEKCDVFHRKHQGRRSRVRFEKHSKPCCRTNMSHDVAPLAPLDHIDGATVYPAQVGPDPALPDSGPHSLGSKLNQQAVDGTQRRPSDEFVDDTCFSAESFPPVRYRNRDRTGARGSANTVDSGATTWQSPSGSSDEGVTPNIPSGWEKHEDGDGAYFWHVKSGTIQREPPASALVSPGARAPGSNSRDSETSSGVSSGSAASGITRSCTSSALTNATRRPADNAEKRLSVPCYGSACDGGRAAAPLPVRFCVCSLGWCEVDEQCLTAEMSSRTVNRCIVDLTQGGGDCTTDRVGRWGEGKSLVLELDEHCLRLLESSTMRVLNSQPIHAIRVWGVGRDNTKDFAYVARDRLSRRYLCHVFRCDVPARLISNTLRDICKQIMIDRSLSQSVLAHRHPPSSDRNSTPGFDSRGNRKPRPTSLMLYDRQKTIPTSLTNLSLACSSFPTPQDEPSQVLTAHYMGSVPVSRPSGIDVLNSALDTLVNVQPDARSRWPLVDIIVSPSTITVRHHDTTHNGGAPLLECRVRFLSFLGIGREVEHCGVVVHTAHDVFVAHGFQCETSAGPLCRAVETACQLRYQKCLDGGRSVGSAGASSGSQIGAWSRSRLGDTLRSMIGSLSGRQRVSAAET